MRRGVDARNGRVIVAREWSKMRRIPGVSDEALHRGFIPAPEHAAERPEWRRHLVEWATEERRRRGSRLYDAEAQAWASRAYAQGMIMLWDQELIDHRLGCWTVDRLCDRAEREFGGYDVVVLWNNYPLSGLDPRNQLDYFDDLPGGRSGLRDAARRFHDRGVRVLVPHQPWVPGVPAGHASVEEALVELAVECELDGFFLDCGDGPANAFRELLARRGGPARAFCSEAAARLEPAGHEVAS